VFRKNLRKLAETSFFEYFFMVAVLMNTVVLCMDGLLNNNQEETVKTMTSVLTYVFVAEMVIKITAFGLKGKKNLFYSLNQFYLKNIFRSNLTFWMDP